MGFSLAMASEAFLQKAKNENVTHIWPGGHLLKSSISLPEPLLDASSTEKECCKLNLVQFNLINTLLDNSTTETKCKRLNLI